MKVREVMTTKVVTIAPDATFREVVDTLLANDVSGLPVVESGGRLVGIVTEADVVSRDAYGTQRRRPLGLLAEILRGHDPKWVRKAAGLTAAELMTAAPMTVSPDDDIAFAARRMLESNRKRLPVVADDQVVGIVSRQDLMQPFPHNPKVVGSNPAPATM